MNKFIAILKNPWLTRVYLLILLLWMIIFFYLQAGDFLKTVGDSEPRMIFFALLPYFAVVGIINPYLHSIAYKEMGSKISFWQAFRIFHLSRIGNYLPGRVWFATNYYLFSKKLNIDTEKIARNFVVLNALLFLVGGVCTLPIISLFSPVMQKLLILFPFLMLLLIHPRILNKILSLFFKNMNGKGFRYIFLVKISMLYFTAYVILGISLYLCVLAFQVVDYSSLPLIIAAMASSLIIGLLAIFAPAGIGISEGISSAILSQIVPLASAVMIVIAFRIVMVVVDFTCALISAVSVAKDQKNEA